MATTDSFVEMVLDTLIPSWIRKRNNNEIQRGAGLARGDEIAMDTFRQRISMHQAAMGSHYQRAPGFDYVRWKQQGQHRMHHNPDEYVLMCQGLAPYINSVAASSYEGLEERRWAGLTQAPPSLGLQPRSASRSAFGSKELLAK